MSSYVITAQNTDTESENRIHGDDVARAYGFRGGLVPGVLVYRYLCPAIVVSLGQEWPARGAVALRLLKPVYDGDRITVAAELREDGDALVTVTNEAGETCATAEASLPTVRLHDPGAGDYAADPPPAERPPATPESLVAGADLGAVEIEAGPDEAHPAEALRLANRIFVANFRVSPWIHAGSRVQHFRELQQGARLQVRGRVAAVYEKKGHGFVDLDLLVLADGAAAAHVVHTAIYRLAEPS
ncbi:MAG TPA: hypothetical protein VF137_11095 [Candidatus Dormibacteraeota bacterium]